MATKTKEVELLRDVERWARSYIFFYSEDNCFETKRQANFALENLRLALRDIRQRDIIRQHDLDQQRKGK
jgi:hypothetical protein